MAVPKHASGLSNGRLFLLAVTALTYRTPPHNGGRSKFAVSRDNRLNRDSGQFGTALGSVDLYSGIIPFDHEGVGVIGNRERKKSLAARAR
jgi:hypothetical protein